MPAVPSRSERIRALPPPVFDELYSDDDYEQTHALAERYKLNKEQEEALSNTLSDIFLKDIALDRLPQTLVERLKVPEDVAKKIAVDVAGTRLLRLLDYFGDVPAQILGWGGDPKSFLSVRSFDDRAALVLAEEISKRLNLNLAGDAMQKLAAMVGSRVRGIRDDSEFKEALSRSAAKGGIAANADAAQKILEEVLRFLKEEKAKPKTEEREESPTPQALRPTPPADVTEIPALRDWVVAASGMRFDGVAAKRFGELVQSRLEGSRDAAAFKEVLTRGTKVGGLGLDALAADKVIQLAEAAAVRSKSLIANRKSDDMPPAISDKPEAVAPPLLGATHEEMVGAAKPVTKVSKSESQKVNEAGSRLVAPAPRSNNILRAERSEVEKSESRRKVTAPSVVAPPNEDELEIASAAQALPEKVPIDAAGISAKLQDTVTTVLRLSGLKFPNSDIQKRLENTVSARLRDVRDTAETMEMLTRGMADGGLGLTEPLARDLLKILEEHFQTLQAELGVEKKRELEDWKRQEAAKSEGRKSARGLAEVASRDALMARITAKSKKAQKMAGRPVAMPAPPTPYALRPTPPVTAPAPVATAPPKVPSESPTGRPKMQDVRFTPKLVGPVEELRAITLTDFRRLSKDPKEAAIKIRDKVDLLGQESYTQRIVGVTAWQESEVYRLYLEVLRESLGGGKPPKEVIAGRNAAGKPTLTDTEFAAIMELSRTLRL